MTTTATDTGSRTTRKPDPPEGGGGTEGVWWWRGGFRRIVLVLIALRLLALGLNTERLKIDIDESGSRQKTIQTATANMTSLSSSSSPPPSLSTNKLNPDPDPDPNPMDEQSIGDSDRGSPDNSKGESPPSDLVVDSKEEESSATTKPLISNNSNATISISAMPPHKRLQIQNYRGGTGLMLNVHATHHGGTSFCARLMFANTPPAPNFACMHDQEHRMPEPPELCSRERDPYCLGENEIISLRPWTFNQTEHFIDRLRPYFHLVSWEFSGPKKSRVLARADYEHPRLLSVVITRDPISRLLKSTNFDTKATKSEKKKMKKNPALGRWDRAKWWEYAVYGDSKLSNNFFLRIIASQKRPQRTPEQQALPNHAALQVERTTEELMELFPTGIDEAVFERAKAMLDRFTVVLDIACLDAGIDALADMLGMDVAPQNHKHHHTHQPNRERIGNDDVYEYLLEKNKWDIKLYEYSKTISLVRCDSL